MITSNGYCEHVDGDLALTCDDWDFTGISGCEEKCTNLTSCVGFTYMAVDNLCFLYPSDGTCGNSPSCSCGTAGIVAKTVKDLVPGSAPVDESACYGKTDGNSILEFEVEIEVI